MDDYDIEAYSQRKEERKENIVFVLISEQIEKHPFNDEMNEGLPDCYLRVYSESTDTDYSPDTDIQFSDEADLVKQFYIRKGVECPIPIKRFHELYNQQIKGVDGETHIIQELMLYLAAYGVEYENLYFVRKVPTVAAICDDEAQAQSIIRNHAAQLRSPRIAPVMKDNLLPDGYGCIFY